MTPDARQVEADPIETIRLQLLEAARSRKSHTYRRRQRRFMVAAAMSAVTLAAGTAVAAVGNFSTGVSVVDRLLQVEGESMGNEVGAGGATEPIRIPAGRGGLSVVAYATSSNAVCVGHGVNGTDDSPEGGLGGCFPARSLANDLDRDPIVWATSTLIGGYRLFVGYADAAVADVRVRNANAQANVRLTPPWTPPGANGRGIRLLAVYDQVPAQQSHDPYTGMSKLLAREPEVEALDKSGHTIP